MNVILNEVFMTVIQSTEQIGISHGIYDIHMGFYMYTRDVHTETNTTERIVHFKYF